MPNAPRFFYARSIMPSVAAPAGTSRTISSAPSNSYAPALPATVEVNNLYAAAVKGTSILGSTVESNGDITSGSGTATSILLAGSTGMITASGATGGLTVTTGTVTAAKGRFGYLDARTVNQTAPPAGAIYSDSMKTATLEVSTSISAPTVTAPGGTISGGVLESATNIVVGGLVDFGGLISLSRSGPSTLLASGGITASGVLEATTVTASGTITGNKLIGGTSTNASGSYATVVGGVSCVATGTASTVAGGQSNQSTANHATVCGGNGSTATGVGSLSGGTFCSAGGASAVSLGNNNAASAAFSICSGGNGGKASGQYSGTLAGSANEAAAFYSIACGGNNNKIWVGADNSIILGGNGNNINSGNNTVIIGGTGTAASQSNTAYTQRLTTRGGRQKRVDMYTANVTLGLDHHVVGLNNTSATIPLVATLPTSPVDGQEYFIKCLTEITTPAKASVTVYTGVGGKAILSPNGVGYLTTPALPRGSTLHLIYVSVDGSWAEIGTSNQETFKLGSTTGAINLYYDVTHAAGSSTNGSSFFVCRNSDGTDIGGFSQATASGINVHYLNLVQTSDYRLKHDINPLEGGLSRITALNPITYAWNDDSSRAEGFLAHELGEHLPSAVFGEKDAVDPDGAPIYQRIDQTKLIPHLVGAIQELSQRLATLEAAR